jgi:hypothetical protein
MSSMMWNKKINQEQVAVSVSDVKNHVFESCCDLRYFHRPILVAYYHVLYQNIKKKQTMNIKNKVT